MHALWADLDGEGLPDLYVVRRGAAPGGASRDLILRGGAEAIPAPRMAGAGLEVCAGDLDRDGDTDLVVVNQDRPPRLLLNSGPPRFRLARPRRGVAPRSVGIATTCVVADLDGDGRFDIFLGGRRPARGHLFGRPGVGAPGQGLLPDRGHRARLARHRAGDMIWFNRPDGRSGARFVSRPVGGNRWTGTGAGAVDLDRDGRLDLLLRLERPNARDEARWWWGFLGSVLRDEQRPRLVRAAAPPTSRVALLSNLGQRGQAWVETTRAAGLPRASQAVGVIQGRKPALLLEQPSGALRLATLEHEAPGAQLLLRLVARGPNRHAVGSLVQVSSAGHAQLRQVGHASGLPAGPPGVVHLGLGQALRAEQVHVRWPSGRWQRFVDLPTGTLVTLTEAGGATWSAPPESGPASPPEPTEPPGVTAPAAGPAQTLVLVHGDGEAALAGAAELCKKVRAALPDGATLEARRLGPGSPPGCTLQTAENNPALTQLARRYRVLLPLLVLVDAEGRVIKFVGGGLGPDALGL